MTKMKGYLGEIILLGASVIWGTAFIFQRIANGVMAPYTFVTVRSLIASVVMGGALLIRARYMPKKQLASLGQKQGYLLAIYAGLAISLAMILQQIGLVGTTSGKAGFLTSFYIIFVPLLGFLIKRIPTPSVWFGLLAAILGFYFLSFTSPTTLAINGYDLLILGCAVAYAFQIFFIDRIQGRIDSLMFSFVQFSVATVVTAIPMLINEGIDFSFLSNQAAIGALLYVGVMSSCVAYTLQIVGQKRAKSAPVATLIMSLEAVFALLAGIIFLQEPVIDNQWIGMTLIFLGILIVNLPWAKFFIKLQK
jgi:drug/metabolite transporter (DMT)-like permease